MRHRTLVALFLGLLAASCTSEPRMLQERRELHIIGKIRQTLLESVAAEKSAVLATTDEESKALALEAEQSADRINRLRGELRTLIEADGRNVESAKLDAFDAAWTDLERVDRRLLALAVTNTNLKAARLSAGQGAAALDRLVDLLDEMMQGARDAETLRVLSATAIAALRIQPLLLAHIPSADEAEMAAIEERMRAFGEEVERDLATLHGTNEVSPDQLAAAAAAWTAYQKILREVLRLSRENSNVISSDVSVHEKRLVTQRCLNALSALEDAVSAGPRATR